MPEVDGERFEGLAVVSDVTVEGRYVLTVQAGEHRAWTLSESKAVRYARSRAEQTRRGALAELDEQHPAGGVL